jgi:hypothetical protein
MRISVYERFTRELRNAGITLTHDETRIRAWLHDHTTTPPNPQPAIPSNDKPSF